MYQEEFNSIIKDKNRLLELDSTLMRSIAERYPYCQPVQALYAKKLQTMGSPLAQDQLRKTAAIVFDRKVFYQWMEKTQLARPLLMHVADDVVEESEETEEINIPLNGKAEEQLEEQNNILDVPEIIATEEPQTEQNTILMDAELPETEEEISVEDQKEPEQIEVPEISVEHEQEEIPEIQEITEDRVHTQEETPVPEVSEESVEDLTEGELPEEGAVEEEPKEFVYDEQLLLESPVYDLERELGPLPEDEKLNIHFQRPEHVADDEIAERPAAGVTNSFIGWLQSYSVKNTGHLVAMDPKNAPIRKYAQKNVERQEEVKQPLRELTEDIAGELARKSIQSDDKLVTETYARILVMQGKYQQAIGMYQKLSLLKPQKSDYFAALIDQLVKRIK